VKTTWVNNDQVYQVAPDYRQSQRV